MCSGPFSSLATADSSTTYNAFEKWPSSAGSTATDFSALSSFYSAGTASTNPLSEFSSSTGRNPFFPPLTGASSNFYNGAMDGQQQIVDLTSGKTNGVFCGPSMADSPMLKVPTYFYIKFAPERMLLCVFRTFHRLCFRPSRKLNATR